MKLSNMKLSVKIGGGFSIVLALLMAVAGTGYWGISKITDTTVKMLHGDAVISEHANRARAGVVGLSRYEKDIFLHVGDKEKVSESLKQWETQYERLMDRIRDLEKAASLPEHTEQINVMKRELASYSDGLKEICAAIDRGEITTSRGAMEAFDKYENFIRNLETRTKGLADAANKRMEEAEDDITARSQRLIIISSILSFISLIVGAGFAIWLTIIITRPINRVVAGLAESSSQVAAAASQVAAASQSLAEGTSQQAASLEETSASLEELSSMTRQNADHSNQAKAMISESQKIV
jgi:methyl-accepting chemotaxis protein